MKRKDCYACGKTRKAVAAHSPCCSSHGRPLCCQCYKRFHFVEVGPNPCHVDGKEVTE